MFSVHVLPNNAINMDSEKQAAFVAPLFTSGYGERWLYCEQAAEIDTTLHRLIYEKRQGERL